MDAATPPGSRGRSPLYAGADERFDAEQLERLTGAGKFPDPRAEVRAVVESRFLAMRLHAR